MQQQPAELSKNTSHASTKKQDILKAAGHALVDCVVKAAFLIIYVISNAREMFPYFAEMLPLAVRLGSITSRCFGNPERAAEIEPTVRSLCLPPS